MTASSRGAKKSDELPRVISPELRRRLQERYGHAQSLMARPQYDFQAAHQLLAESLKVDPGNLRYIDLLLLNLKRREAAGIRAGLLQRWLGGTPLGARAAMERALAGADWQDAIRLAPDVLWNAGLDAAALGLAADACRGLQLGPAQLQYRQVAVEADPNNPEPVRRMAQSLMACGQYEDARDWWRRLLALLPDDSEAVAETTHSEPAQSAEEEVGLRATISANPADVEALLRLADLRIAAGDFDEGQRMLSQASAVGGGDLQIREAWEKFSLAQSEQRLALAQQAAEREASEAATRLVASLKDEHDRLELGIVHSRAERFPGDGGLKLDLGRRLKRSGNYSGADQRFEELRQFPGYERIALVELGECWQHLRQFQKAIDFYRRAIEFSPNEDDGEVEQTALYRGAVLAEALGQPAEACVWLERLLASAGAYKDARERLDKLRPICDKNGFSAG